METILSLAEQSYFHLFICIHDGRFRVNATHAFSWALSFVCWKLVHSIKYLFLKVKDRESVRFFSPSPFYRKMDNPIHIFIYILMDIIIYKRLWQYWLVIDVCYEEIII